MSEYLYEQALKSIRSKCHQALNSASYMADTDLAWMINNDALEEVADLCDQVLTEDAQMLSELQISSIKDTNVSIDQRIAEILKEAQAVSEYPEVGVCHLACRLSFAEREIVGLKAAVAYLRNIKGMGSQLPLPKGRGLSNP